MCTAVGPTSSQLRARQSFHLSPTALSVWSGGVDSGRERRRRPRGPKLCRSGSGRSAQDPHTKLIHLFFDHRARPSIIPAPSGTLPQRKNQGRARQPAGSSVRLFSFLSFPLIFFFIFILATSWPPLQRGSGPGIRRERRNGGLTSGPCVRCPFCSGPTAGSPPARPTDLCSLRLSLTVSSS